MKYWCENCKEAFDEDELERYDEPRPGAYGQPCYETFWVCPCCGEVPTEYDYQDKTCSNCTLFGTEECPYGDDRNKDDEVCGDFVDEED